MPKGSQLSQLKSALSQAGFTGRPQKGSKRKRSGAVEKDKEARAAKLREINKRLNLFDVKVTKLKHDVGGRKVKGVTGKPAQSRQAGIEQRKKTLLKELEERGHAGEILDRRFGENDPTMSLEERMLERFTRERQRASKGIAFNLENEDDLTHFGQSLSKLDDFDDAALGLEDDEEDEGQIEAAVVKHTHFGGFDEDDEDDVKQPEKKRSKAEVMAEVIAKSKEHKMLGQMEREHGQSVRNELDQDFDMLHDLLYAPDPSSTIGDSVLPGSRVDSIVPPVVFSSTSEAYDRHVRELAFDKRARPKDRTKTEEELCLEAKEALEKAERRRQKRMLGLEESDSEDEGSRRKKRRRGGDDLEDDLDEEEEGVWGGLGAGLELGPSADDADEEETSERESDNGDEQHSGSGDSTFSGTGHEASITTQRSASGTEVKRMAQKKELPFTFACPSTHEEFLTIVDDVEEKDIPTVVNRIRTLYHTSLGSDNKFKLQKLMTVLIDHILHVSSPPDPCFSLVSPLIPHLNALIKAYPVQSAEYFIKKLSLMHNNLKRGLSLGPLDLAAKTWPGLPELVLLRIIGSTWSTSDLNHAVVSPARILMGAYLGLGRVRSLADIASGLFLCTLFLQFEAFSKRIVPEAIHFIINAVLHLAPHSYQSATSLPGFFASPDFQSALLKGLSLDRESAASGVYQKVDLPRLLQGQPTVQDKLNLLAVAIELLGKYAEMYKSLDGFIELYDPILEVISNVDVDILPEAHRVRVGAFKMSLERLLKFARQARRPLQLQAHKPIPIPTYIPKFEMTTSAYLRRQDPDRERNEAAKLRKQYKQERKGAIRELRKDAKFLAAVEQEKQAEKDRAYHERMKRVLGSMESERAEEKAMEREKAKANRRAGRK